MLESPGVENGERSGIIAAGCGPPFGGEDCKPAANLKIRAVITSSIVRESKSDCEWEAAWQRQI
jgi:hypothetical protein